MGVVAAADQQAVSADLEIVAHALLVGGEGALGGFVGRLVRREADIAVGPEYLSRPKSRLQVRQERLQRSLDAVLVDGGMGMPPVAVVVLLQLGVELRCRSGDALECAHDQKPRDRPGRGPRQSLLCGQEAARPGRRNPAPAVRVSLPWRGSCCALVLLVVLFGGLSA